VLRYTFAGGCRNDGFTKAHDAMMFYAIVFNAIIVPIARGTYEGRLRGVSLRRGRAHSAPRVILCSVH
jgi:hypothetical protein